MEKSEPKKCRRCQELLILGENWSESSRGSRSYECNKCCARRKRPDAAWRLGEQRDRQCLDCGIVLVRNENWPESLAANYSNVCNKCQSDRQMKWQETKRGFPFKTRSEALSGRRQTPEHVAKRTQATKLALAAITRECAECGDPYSPTSPRQIYCPLHNRRPRHKERQPSRPSILPVEYLAFVEIYGESCGICGSKTGSRQGGRLAVDHCHKHGHVRGLLCHRCNTAIGLLGDDPERLKAAAAYLIASMPREVRNE